MTMHLLSNLHPTRIALISTVVLWLSLGDFVLGFHSSSSHRCISRLNSKKIQLQATIDPFAEGAPNLYEILGASPSDSDAILKKKWQQLARKLHPDANIIQPANTDTTDSDKPSPILTFSNIDDELSNNVSSKNQYPYDFSDVNAAWTVLSNPKDRRRYDRELQAKEMADNFEAMMDAGIRNAIPFLQKTAKTTAKAVETSAKTWGDVSKKSSRVMSDVNKRVITAAAIFDLDSESRELEVKAARAMAKAKQIEIQINTQHDRRIQLLSEPNSRLTSTDASRFLQKFNLTDEELPATANEIAALEKLELDYKTVSLEYQQIESTASAASRQAVDAIKAEERAAERLRQAQVDLEAAQAKSRECQAAKLEALQAEDDAKKRANKIFEKIRKQTEYVRSSLRRNEEITLEREAFLLQLKKQRIEESAAEVKNKAEEIKKKANVLRMKARQEEEENAKRS